MLPRNKRNKKLITLSALTTFFVLPFVVFAFDPSTDFPPLVGGAGDVAGVISDLITKWVWPIFGAFAVIMFIVAGILFLTAQGDPSKMELAKKALIGGVIGVVVGLVAFSIPFIIFNLLFGL